jgi:DNA-binding NarL/FixJ family response regulator
MPKKSISVLIAEDHELVRLGIAALLQREPGIVVVGEAGTGHEAVSLVKSLSPKVVIMDLAMPELNGFEATGQISSQFPHTKVLILSAYSSREFVQRTVARGATGFLSKDNSLSLLIEAVRETAAGRPFFCPEAQKLLGNSTHHKPDCREFRVDGHTVKLTEREDEVLRLVAAGLANKQMAVQLGISIKTVEKHRQRVMDKLDIHDTAGLTRYALAEGIVDGTTKRL